MLFGDVSYGAGGRPGDAITIDGRLSSATVPDCGAVLNEVSAVDVGRKVFGNVLADPRIVIKMEGSCELCGSSPTLGEDRGSAVYGGAGSDGN